ncbi:MAG: DUF4838 domain-containing protein [Clostridia bacterium]|nr:DUF4838 domain-containing protein [Clostridia bacterium]
MRKLVVKGRELTALKYLPGEDEVLKSAAEELSSYLFRTAGVTPDGDFPVVIEYDGTTGRDGFNIKVGSDQITISCGGGGGPMHGVYGFLTHYAEMRFFTPETEYHGSGVINVDEDYAYTPVFEYRQSDWHCGDDISWSLKNGINNRPIPEKLGGHIRYGAFVHTIGFLTGTPQDSQPCLSDPALLEKAKGAVRDILKKDPGCTIISVSQNDNLNFCKCGKCAAVDEAEGSHMGTLLRFVNEIADDVKDDYPHVVIDTLAYQYTRKPPRLTRPRKNVCVRLCSIECCFCHPLTDSSCERNRAFYDDIIAWNKICDRLYIWDYVTDFAHYVPTYPNFGVLRENMRFFADHHVKGMYPEGAWNAPVSGEFAELRAYILARLMWNPYMSSADYSKEIDAFLAAYYGGGWRMIRAYIDVMCALTVDRHMGIATPPSEYLDYEKLAALENTIDSLWDEAEKEAGDRLDAVVRSRIQWRYLKLELHPDPEKGRQLNSDCERLDIKWNEWLPVDPEKADFGLPPSRWVKLFS